jgi:putative ABC transport system permease protein
VNNNKIFMLGYRNLFLHRQRQIFLAGALTLCFALISLLTLVSEGMSRNVNASSRIHYGGDLFVTGFYGGNQDRPAWINQPKLIVSLTEDVPGLVVPRSDLFKSSWIYYQGKPQLIKNCIGLDYSLEKELLSRYEVTEGDLDLLGQPGNVVLSSALGESLGLQAGDQITLKTTNPKGQINTGSFTVGALIRDDTLLGYYRLFIDRENLNVLLGWEPGDFSSLGVYLDNPDQTEEWTNLLYQRLSQELSIAAPVSTRAEYYSELEKSWTGIRYFVYAVSLYVSEVDDLLHAMDLVSYFIYLMMLVITFVSVLVTYRILLHDRSRELAVFQAMGMTGSQVEGMLLIESGILLLISLTAGTLLSFLFMAGLKPFSFEGIQGFGIFLNKGKLTGNFVLSRFCFNISVILAGVLPAVWVLIRREVRRPLAVTLKGEK